jgi:hypothetical protein
MLEIAAVLVAVALLVAQVVMETLHQYLQVKVTMVVTEAAEIRVLAAVVEHLLQEMAHLEQEIVMAAPVLRLLSAVLQ